MRDTEETRETEVGQGQLDPRVTKDLLETRDCQVRQDPGEREEGRECEVRWDRRGRRAEQLYRARSDHGDCRDLRVLRAGWADREPRAVLEARGCRD